MSEFEELLDGVLRETAEAEPRAGMEGRVLARVLAEGTAPGRVGWRRLLRALVPVAACAGLVLAVRGVPHGGSGPRVGTEVRRAAGVGEGTPLVSRAVVPVEVPRTAERRLTLRSVRVRARREGGGDAAPKLASFPVVAQRGALTGWFGGRGAVVLPGRGSPELAKAYEGLRAAQNEPLRVAAIEIPLLAGSETQEEQGERR